MRCDYGSKEAVCKVPPGMPAVSLWQGRRKTRRLVALLQAVPRQCSRELPSETRDISNTTCWKIWPAGF